jgi:hypothetical protein
MATKKYVSVKIDAKDVYDSALRDGVLKVANETVTDAINNKSNGKLSTKDKSDDGFLLTASIAIKPDNKDKPTKLDGKVSLTVITIGSSAKAFTGSKGGSAEGFGSRVKDSAVDLTAGITEKFMPDVIKTMLKL